MALPLPSVKYRGFTVLTRRGPVAGAAARAVPLTTAAHVQNNWSVWVFISWNGVENLLEEVHLTTSATTPLNFLFARTEFTHDGRIVANLITQLLIHPDNQGVGWLDVAEGRLGTLANLCAAFNSPA